MFDQAAHDAVIPPKALLRGRCRREHTRYERESDATVLRLTGCHQLRDVHALAVNHVERYPTLYTSAMVLEGAGSVAARAVYSAVRDRVWDLLNPPERVALAAVPALDEGCQF